MCISCNLGNTTGVFYIMNFSYYVQTCGVHLGLRVSAFTEKVFSSCFLRRLATHLRYLKKVTKDHNGYFFLTPECVHYPPLIQRYQYQMSITWCGKFTTFIDLTEQINNCLQGKLSPSG